MVLLLDVRDTDEYSVCHIQTAYRYPAATVNRTVNPFTPEMLSFKNHPLKKIVIYDRDEKIACPAANLLFEKGFDNIVVLSGGLQEFFQKHPELIVGEVPKEWYPPVLKKKTRPPSVASLNSTKKASITKEKTKSTGPKPFK
ncbi:predicted protein [Naegleria gruberi]|uniref:Predicted protein n=1 Tax=Naegleria gruberi TaxID=5762 RepID=D2V792_NAEGR|nr:uncharacterized protein NAEGRDRAFT_31695 [Naegleria gruberi]EFC47217.1 predicted protein [Naegleria gruberi]|eukprot:XP_002679961.1 predicted protein [Naegleria gruberi strain NEG-M]